MSKFVIPVSRWKQVTEEEALDDDWDTIPTLTAFTKTRQFCQRLENHRDQLEKLIARHLGISISDFTLLGQEHWV
jgi:chromatin segregation and condensation protein Rec8/ScpA/Scc1 (kleisin family)